LVIQTSLFLEFINSFKYYFSSSEYSGLDKLNRKVSILNLVELYVYIFFLSNSCKVLFLFGNFRKNKKTGDSFFNYYFFIPLKTIFII
jgi:hypothetical protein